MTSQNVSNSSSLTQRYQPVAIVGPYKNDSSTVGGMNNQANNASGNDWPPPTVPARTSRGRTNAAAVISASGGVGGSISPNSSIPTPPQLTQHGPVQPPPPAPPHYIPPPSLYPDQFHHNNLELTTHNNQSQQPGGGCVGHDVNVNRIQSPRSEVKLNSMPWFHGKISREQAENLLLPRIDGQFLVRESTNFPGDYTLCVCWQNHVEHYRVKYRDHHLTIDDEEFFENLTKLVEHYQQDADGLCTQLTKCLPKVQQDFIDTKPFADAGWIIQDRDLELREPLGKGEFGEVFLGLLRGEKVAVKMLKDSSEAAQKFLTEASLMTSLRHENLVQLMGLVVNNRHICLVTEYMSKGSLVDYLRSRGRLHVTKKDQINFAFDAASGMEYLEMRRVVHRDLAARNVLISECGVAKVSDFGLARTECGNSDTGKLPIKWTAPEALKHNKFSNKSDMWSFGILLWEIYSFGRVPYPRIPLADVVKHVEKGYKMEAPEGCPSEIYEIMRQAWDLLPDKRPTFRDVKVKLAQLKSTTT